MDSATITFTLCASGGHGRLFEVPVMSIQWVIETTFLLPRVTRFQGYKLHAENAAKWVEASYESPEGQRFLTERDLVLTPELQAEDTVRDLEMLINALRLPIAQLTMLGYNVTHVVVSMAPYVPHYLTVIGLARYTTHDYHTPYPIDYNDSAEPSIRELIPGFSWYEYDQMLPWGAGVGVALLMAAGVGRRSRSWGYIYLL